MAPSSSLRAMSLSVRLWPSPGWLRSLRNAGASSSSKSAITSWNAPAKGCGQTEIAKLLGTTANTVNVTLMRAKKKGKKK